MRKDRSYALAVVLGITWMVNIVCLAFHIFNTPSTYAIVALMGTILTGMVPSIARGLNDCSKGIGFPIAIGSLLHIGAGLVGAIFVGLTVGETDNMVLPILAAYSNILCNGVAHQLFLDDDRQVKGKRYSKMICFRLIKFIVSLAGVFASMLVVVDPESNTFSGTIHIVAFLVILVLDFLYKHVIYVIRFYVGSAMSVISSYAIAANGSEYDTVIFVFVILLLVVGHWAPTLDDLS